MPDENENQVPAPVAEPVAEPAKAEPISLEEKFSMLVAFLAEHGIHFKS